MAFAAVSPPPPLPIPVCFANVRATSFFDAIDDDVVVGWWSFVRSILLVWSSIIYYGDSRHPIIILPLFVKPVLSHLVFLITLRDECGDRFFSFFLSFVLSFFRSFVLFSVNFQSPHSVFILCSFLIIARYYYKTLRGEKKKRGGTRKKKFERRDKKKALETRTQMERSAARLLKIQWFNKKKRTTTKKFTHRSRGVYYIHFFRDSHAF